MKIIVESGWESVVKWERFEAYSALIRTDGGGYEVT